MRVCFAALSFVTLGLSGFSNAMAQTTQLAERPLTQTKDFDRAAIEEGLKALRQNGECTVHYVVAWTGRAKDVIMDCSVPGMSPYILRAFEAAEWQAEIMSRRLLDSDRLTQTFKFGITINVDPRGEKAPVLTTPIDHNEVRRAIAEVGGKVERCDVTFTVGVDGSPKDVATNCKPPKLDPWIAQVIGKMRFTPAEKDGRPTDWPGMSIPMLFVEIG